MRITMLWIPPFKEEGEVSKRNIWALFLHGIIRNKKIRIKANSYHPSKELYVKFYTKEK